MILNGTARLAIVKKEEQELLADQPGLKKSRPTYYLPSAVLVAIHNTFNSSLILQKSEAKDWE